MCSSDLGRGYYILVSEHGSTLRLDGQCVDHAFMLVAYVLSMLVIYMCLLHLFCVGHGSSGVTMEGLMVLLSTCFHECMTGYMLFLLMYSSCTLTYMLLYVVYALLVYARSHIGYACMFSMYACLCEVIC